MYTYILGTVKACNHNTLQSTVKAMTC